MTAPPQAGSACYLYGISERRVSIAILALCTISLGIAIICAIQSKGQHSMQWQRSMFKSFCTSVVAEADNRPRACAVNGIGGLTWTARVQSNMVVTCKTKLSLNKVCKTAWAEGLWDEVPGVWSSRPRLGYSGRRKMSTTSDLRERGPGGEGGSRRG